jgi:hypothetical protein
LYIAFNYTAVFETAYSINKDKIIHIHGSLRIRDGEPVLGHGNKMRIEKNQERREEAEGLFDEKWLSICRVVKDYYIWTYKDPGRYSFKLFDLSQHDIEEIYIIGHSIAGVDQLYFKTIDVLTKKNAKWNVCFYRDDEKQTLRSNLIDCEIDGSRKI